MPRLRPLPNEEVLPKNVEIELEPEGTVNLSPDDNLAELPTDSEAEKEAKRQAAREYRQNKKKEDEARTLETSDLKKQLEEMRAAVEESRKATQEAQRRQAEIAAQAQERERESSQYLTRAEEAEYNSVLTAMAAAEGEAESAQRDLEAAVANADGKAQADAQRRMARAESKLVQLEEGKNILEQRKNAAIAKAEDVRRNPPPPQNLSVEQQIDSVQALLPSQKEWLKSHTDSWTDQRKNMRLQGAHVEAEDKGLAPGSKKYFEYLEERLGYKQAQEPDEDDENEEDDPPQRKTQRRTLVSAPVSREATNNNGKPSRTKITLTPKQQEAAAIAGISQEVYARNLLKLEGMKEDGYYE